MTLTHIQIKVINSKEKKKYTSPYVAILPSHLALRKKEKKKSWKV